MKKIDPTSTVSPNISSFDDYRDFLKAKFNFLKANKSAFSHKYCERKLSASAGYLKAIFSKKRNIGFNNIFPIANLFELSEQEREYFSIKIIMVLTNDPRMRQYFSGILARMHYSLFVESKNMEGSTVDTSALSNSIYIELIEMTKLEGYECSVGWIKNHLSEGELLTDGEIEQALNLIKAKGWIHQNLQGGWEMVDDIKIVADPYTKGAIEKVNRPGLERSLIVLKNPDAYRQNGFFTGCMAFDEDGELEVEKLYAEFRDKLFNLAATPTVYTRVVRFGIQYFRVAKSDIIEK